MIILVDSNHKTNPIVKKTKLFANLWIIVRKRSCCQIKYLNTKLTLCSQYYSLEVERWLETIHGATFLSVINKWFCLWLMLWIFNWFENKNRVFFFRNRFKGKDDEMLISTRNIDFIGLRRVFQERWIVISFNKDISLWCIFDFHQFCSLRNKVKDFSIMCRELATFSNNCPLCSNAFLFFYFSRKAFITGIKD